MKSKRFCSLIFVILFIAGLISCDDYNIVEPRFYDEDDIGIYIDKISRTFYFALPYESYVEFYLLGSAGNIVRAFVDGQMISAGYHAFPWNWRDDDGNKLKDGIYCLLLIAGDYKHFRCFEYDDPEDYLP